MVRAARMLLRWEQKDLAEASGIALSTIKRLETKPGPLGAHGATIQVLRLALEKAGVTFIEGNTCGVQIAAV
ncbi:MAG: multiprotein-bridging factor 1 family protein [Methylobacteriaceae bacterium]